jgi:hypothetical protein
MDFSAFIITALMAFPFASRPALNPVAAFDFPVSAPTAGSHFLLTMPPILITANSPQMKLPYTPTPCDPSVPIPRMRAQHSGIQGKVHLLSGNKMPSPPRRPGDSIHLSSGGPGVKSTICVFELTNDSEIVRKGNSPWCEAVHTRLLRQIDTDDEGNFAIPIPPGTYSVFTKKGGLFYASRRDERNNIAPVIVLPGKMTRVDCNVESNQKVAY